MYQKADKAYEEIVAENLKRLMRLKDYSTRSLGERLGVSSMAVSYWCRAVNAPKPAMIEKICQVLNVSREELTTDMDAIPNLSIPAARPVPLIGRICAGDGILAQQHFEGYYFVDNSVKADFCLRVEGNSMIDADIRHGDIAFLRKNFDIVDGEIYGVVFGDNENATLKRVYKQDNGVLLMPANKEYRPITVKEGEPIIICGELVGIFRSV